MAHKQLEFRLMFVCILVTHLTTGTFGAITLAPLNRVVYEGAVNKTITCGSDAIFTTWSFWTLFPFDFPGHSGSFDLTYDTSLYDSYNDTFAIEHSQDGTNSLVVFNATISPSGAASFSTAGIYYCIDSYSGDFRGAHQVVIRTDPICSTSLTQSGDVIQLSCTIVYGSYRDYAIDANMTWSVNGQVIPADSANFTITSSPTEVTASSTLFISENLEATYECKTTFNKPGEGTSGGLDGLASKLATNAPDYLKTCSISVTTTTAEVTSTTAPSTTPTKMPPCSLNIIQLLLDLILRARCYDDWIRCSPISLQTCFYYCKLSHFSGGKCETPTSVDCPCIPPGIKKCNCF